VFSDRLLSITDYIFCFPEIIINDCHCLQESVMINGNVLSEDTDKEDDSSADEYDFNYRQRAIYLKKEIASLLQKIDSTTENAKKR
jgi:hypothetical protein